MAILEYRHACGPLDVRLTTNSEVMCRKVAETLDLYNVAWPNNLSSVHLNIHAGSDPSILGEGSYLSCARMHVDTVGAGRLRATFRAGAAATGDASSGNWEAHVPMPDDDPWILTDMESLISLVLTEGWRSAGWVPVHAAAITRNGICAVMCAESGGGKTSLTAAMIRKGWQTLGDDKLLLRIDGERNPELRGLVHTFNLHPRTAGWFPEVGDLTALPVYSEWTEKRKVSPESIWPGTTIDCARPTHLLQLIRNPGSSGVQVEEISPAMLLSSLLHQSVVPSEPKSAKQILSTIAATAQQMKGFSVHIGDNVYEEPGALAAVDEALQSG